MKMSLKTVLTLALATSAAGCSALSNQVKSELSAYAEPSSGELAHIRLVGSRDVKVYPAATCPNVNVLGGGYPAGPQIGGQRKRDLGMPKTGGEPKHYVEIAARAGEPIAAAFALARYAGPRLLNCYVTNTFIPQAGRNYEIEARFIGSQCVAVLYEVVPDSSGFKKSLLPTKSANCPGRSAFGAPSAGVN